MAKSVLPPTDTIPLREALRGLRFLLRRGRDTVADTLSLDALPQPASSLASAVFREADGFARSVDTLASKAAKRVLGGDGSPSASLDQILQQEDAETEFARAIYSALSTVLQRFGAESFFVSEMAARTTFATWRARGISGESTDWLADLTLRLCEGRVVRGTQADKPGNIPIQNLEAMAIFAVLLWLQSSRSDAENEAALDSAADITFARADEVAATVRSGSKQRLAALYRKYVSHV